MKGTRATSRTRSYSPLVEPAHEIRVGAPVHRRTRVTRARSRGTLVGAGVVWHRRPRASERAAVGAGDDRGEDERAVDHNARQPIHPRGGQRQRLHQRAPPSGVRQQGPRRMAPGAGVRRVDRRPDRHRLAIGRVRPPSSAIGVRVSRCGAEDRQRLRRSPARGQPMRSPRSRRSKSVRMTAVSPQTVSSSSSKKYSSRSVGGRCQRSTR